MKRAAIILFCLLLLCCAGCGAARETVVTPPSRVGTEREEADKIELPGYSMEDAYRASTAVAHVKVGNWLGSAEDNEDLHFTYYEVTTVKAFKGDLPEKFVLVQYGDTKVTWIDYPLYTSGDELLVFLTPFALSDEPENVSRENTYRLLNDFASVLNVAFDKTGNVYYIDSYGALGRFTDLPRQNGNDDVFNAVREDLTERDPVIAQTAFRYPFFIYSGADVEQLFLSIGE